MEKTDDYVKNTVERLLSNTNWMFGANETHRRAEPKKSRNSLCECNSGKKFKRCCIKNQRI